PILRVDGVSDITIMGQLPYSMRPWLDPDKLASRNLSAVDVAAAVASQNLAAAPGRVGQPPSGTRQALDLPPDKLGRPTEPEQFGDIIVKVSTPGLSARAKAKPPVFGGAGTGLPGSGATSLQLAGGGSRPVGLPGFPVTVGGATTTTTSGTTTDSGTLSGGATTGGGATAPGGGATSGGRATGGGATAGRGAGGGPAQPAGE